MLLLYFTIHNPQLKTPYLQMNSLRKEIHSSLYQQFPDELINIVHQNLINKPIKGELQYKAPKGNIKFQFRPLFIATYQNLLNEENLFISNDDNKPEIIQCDLNCFQKQSFKISHSGGVAVNQHKNHLYVADDRKILTIDILSGKTIHTYNHNHQLIGLCYNAEFGSIIAGENSNGRLIILDSKNQMSSKYSSKQNLKLNFPWGIKCSSLSNKIYIADNGNNRIAVCDAEGVFDPVCTKNFLDLNDNPLDVAIHSYEDKCGGLVEEFIVTYGDRFTIKRKNFLITTGNYGHGDYEFNNNHGIEWSDATQKLIVCDTNNNRLQFYI